MLENAQGIILRTRRLTESSLIVNWLTPESGRVSTVAKGALRPKSPLRGKLDLFYLCEFTFSRSRRSELHTLREARLLESHPAIRTQLSALQQASYCAALIEQTTETETPIPVMFQMLRGFLKSVQEAPGAAPGRVYALELKMLSELGLEPDWNTGRLSAETRDAAGRLIKSGWKTISQVALPPPVATELRRYLHGVLIYQFGRLARGREAAVS
jgi:DNA repair protein RecO (recombination protein O)